MTLHQKDKTEFGRSATDNNGTIRETYPKKIAEHNDIEPGETIKFQNEWSDKHNKPYSSLWNGDKHGIEDENNG